MQPLQHRFGTGMTELIKLAISAGEVGKYRIAQHDDYSGLSRKDFIHYPPLSLTLQAKVSEKSLPGTWGFGFWNDPFSLGIGVKGSGVRLPALPQAVWFFYGSPKNDLSFHATEAANGWMASVFTSKSCSIHPASPCTALPAVFDRSNQLPDGYANWLPALFRMISSGWMWMLPPGTHTSWTGCQIRFAFL